MALLTLNDIEKLALGALTKAGASLPQASALAKAVMAAERDGIKSHGLVYVPIYCLHLQCGKVIGDAEPIVTQPKPASVHVDAKSGFAHLAIQQGFTPLIDATKQNGVAILNINNSYNCGVLGYHVEELAMNGVVALGFTNAPASIAPVGGIKPVIGTNPFALAVPNQNAEASFVMDQSASVVAKSEIIMHQRAEKPIPEGWALDSDGNPTTDPNIALKGSMVPNGGYKGFSGGLMVEILAATLSGAMLGLEASPFGGTAGGPPKTGQCFIAIDIAAESFYTQLERLCNAITEQENARLPGGRRLEKRNDATKNGIAIDDTLLEKIAQI
ncbi:MAG: Ldh family oxidoreductase [Alphaproteobacteria bacterium]|nr:Ldh family oxidoreductase [Alphaproteobacteria bacterium]